MNLPKNVEIILSRLSSAGYEAFIVGGAVRDSLLGREVKDWDITTNALPEQIKEMFSNYKHVLTGEKHGTVTVVIDSENIEVTTYRKDGNYSDNRHPDSVEFVTSLYEDLARRDLTINALAYNSEKGFIDYFDGLKDLDLGIIRCVGKAEDRFNEDALRMLRAIRFAAQLNFKLDLDVRHSISILHNKINFISSERIQTEINKILLSDLPDVAFCSLNATNLLSDVLPEMANCFGVEQNNSHHVYTVAGHILNVLINTPKVLHLRLAALMHDVGKPLVKTVDETGYDHFYDHETKSYELAKNILVRLKYDNETTEKVLTLVLHHMDSIHPSKRVIRRLLYKLGEETLRDLLILKEADAKGHHLKDLEESLSKIDKAKEVLDQIIENQECFSLKDLAISGKDLIELGYKPGKEFGIILNNLLEKVLENPELNTKKQLIKELKNE